VFFQEQVIHFFDWNTQADGKGDSYNSKQPIEKLDKSLSLYAHWEGKKYTVKFETTGAGEIAGTGEQPVTFGSPYGALPAMYPSGYYEWTGWYTESTGGKEITKDTIVTTAGDHTLYAHSERSSGDGIVKVGFGGAPKDETINFTLKTTPVKWSGGGSLTATVNTTAGQWANGADFVWYLDGAKISGTGSSQTIKARDYALGTHILSVIVSRSGTNYSYSKSVIFKIEE